MRAVGPRPQKVARNSIARTFYNARKRCNSNDLNSMFEIVAGELRAKLGAVSAMRQVRSGRDTCAVATGPGRAASGRPTLQTSSNQRNSNRLTRTPVTNVVNPSPKTTIFSEKAIGLTTFVTTDQKSTRKTPRIDDVCNNTHQATRRSASTAGVKDAGRSSAPGHGADGRRRGLPGYSQQPSPTGAEGAGGSGGHGRASRRGAERSEVA